MKKSEFEGYRKPKELSLLFEISRILDRSMDLSTVLNPVLQAVAEFMHLSRVTLTLFNIKTGEISIEAAYGLSDDQKRLGRYKLGEGLTGKVVESGGPILVPRISDEPRFLNKTGARSNLPKEDISFVCVPIKLGNKVIGTLSADRAFSLEISLEDDVRLLSIVSSMVSQAVRLRREAQEERQRLLDENARLQERLRDRFKPSNIVGNSNVMQQVYDLIAQVSGSNSTVLIQGESGTGKELVAQAIHYNSLRADKPFIKVNCAALPETVIESELFGHEKGAFTGALNQRKGRFELAHGGSIFLDEIGDLSATIQVKLLRVLQEKEFERVGGNETIKTDVRVIAATNRNLEESMLAGEFRHDLYYRLNVFPIHLPPLRERKTDILLLADIFVEKYNKSHYKNVRRISQTAIDMLVMYSWPGNVRELENCIERAVLLSDGDVIHAHHLPPTLQTAEASGTPSGDIQLSLAAVEKNLIVDALKNSRGNMAKAARELGMSERVMGLRVKKYGINPRQFRSPRK